MTLDVLNVVELGSKRVVDVDDDDLPVGLFLIQKGHHTENLNLLDLTGVADKLTDLADVERVIVSLGLGLGVDNVGVFPGLKGRTGLARWGPYMGRGVMPNLRGGRHRSSRGSPCGGSSCARSEACPS